MHHRGANVTSMSIISYSKKTNMSLRYQCDNIVGKPPSAEAVIIPTGRFMTCRRRR